MVPTKSPTTTTTTASMSQSHHNHNTIVTKTPPQLLSHQDNRHNIPRSRGCHQFSRRGRQRVFCRSGDNL
ncbi:hypothetical protein E2C01_102786 [Portunus trituberculatus]|uniref:Uncharacterized protein n=1 Tax=Portunus trituberculatus TaxID=210409 RepID=A0A5B7KNC8_PORTR|nr:hypothetical protein [Portunus trituberculatus]